MTISFELTLTKDAPIPTSGCERHHPQLTFGCAIVLRVTEMPEQGRQGYGSCRKQKIAAFYMEKIPLKDVLPINKNMNSAQENTMDNTGIAEASANN